ncbi:hypothetical protein CK203_117252 [Vitis vinifera]|uniref:Uncharacterized protein n=1 Tax=Vitis vinifera TaxID=29760 RepID=A0A438FD11_VITVI|nr:hypothetical protein CK203_117252 [Vitis vinifera]
MENLPVEDATWENAVELHDRFPDLNLEDKVPVKVGVPINGDFDSVAFWSTVLFQDVFTGGLNLKLLRRISGARGLHGGRMEVHYEYW